MGRKDVNGSFTSFIDTISTAELSFKRNSVRYVSPSQGVIQFGWRGSLKQNGKKITLRDYPRYDNPYAKAKFGSDEIKITRGKESLSLNLKNGMRKVSGSI